MSPQCPCPAACLPNSIRSPTCAILKLPLALTGEEYTVPSRDTQYGRIFEVPSFMISYASETLDIRGFFSRRSPIIAKAACCADCETHVPSPLSFSESTRK